MSQLQGAAHADLPVPLLSRRADPQDAGGFRYRHGPGFERFRRRGETLLDRGIHIRALAHPVVVQRAEALCQVRPCAIFDGACTMGHVELLTSSAMLPVDASPRGSFNLSIIAQITPVVTCKSVFGSGLRACDFP